MENFHYQQEDFVMLEKTERKYKAHNKEHRGILNWLFKNGYCSKQTFGDWLIHSYADKFPEREFRGIKEKCLFIQEDFADFMDYVKKNFIRKYK
jgi:hypothetical protein